MTQYDTDYWRLPLAEGWEWEEDDDDADEGGAVSFFHPDGAGVLSISCSEKELGFVEAADLEEFAGELIEEGKEPTLTQIGALHGLLFEHADNDDWWREWFMACDDLFFYITYTCPLSARGAENDIIRAVLHRLEVIA